MELKSIGDNLTSAEFNAYVCLLRNFVTLNETFRIQDTIIGEYGRYDFDFNDSTLTDKGVLITSETLSATNTISLSNPLFMSSNYHFVFNLINITDYNQLSEKEDYIETEQLEVILNSDEDSAIIDLSPYDEGMVLLLDCRLIVTHDYVKLEGVV